ncbi:hypothetical protein DIZ27_43980 [Streptomyces sp. NWU339]|uniref:hypothetical protein n=1 Tax=Streptomyces sp. NWU339 TaxID=2185284 RepID=UPI000D682BF2|nr:hypothetical protein [Streptomyces sp. NWU339]PWI04657.1 hypothetical protein DIZ27_43980 [Streptomyces sp. NWU339]
MVMTRSSAITAGVAAAAALAATGITYATAAPAPAAQTAPAAVRQAPAPAQAPMGNEGRGNDGREGHEGRKFEEGRIQINERTYPARPGDCILVASGLGSNNFNILNNSRKTVEVFRGATCDNGAPLARVGPGSSGGVTPGHTRGVHVRNGVVASFRVIHHHKGDFHDGDGY